MGHEAKQPLPQREMGLNTQEQLVEGHEARDVQNGGGREVM